MKYLRLCRKQLEQIGKNIYMYRRQPIVFRTSHTRRTIHNGTAVSDLFFFPPSRCPDCCAMLQYIFNSSKKKNVDPKYKNGTHTYHEGFYHIKRNLQLSVECIFFTYTRAHIGFTELQTITINLVGNNPAGPLGRPFTNYIIFFFFWMDGKLHDKWSLILNRNHQPDKQTTKTHRRILMAAVLLLQLFVVQTKCDQHHHIIVAECK